MKFDKAIDFCLDNKEAIQETSDFLALSELCDNATDYSDNSIELLQVVLLFKTILHRNKAKHIKKLPAIITVSVDNVTMQIKHGSKIYERIMDEVQKNMLIGEYRHIFDKMLTFEEEEY